MSSTAIVLRLARAAQASGVLLNHAGYLGRADTVNFSDHAADFGGQFLGLFLVVENELHL
jgi:hypothetical protein